MAEAKKCRSFYKVNKNTVLVGLLYYHFIKMTLFSVCKKESRNENISMLPSSFSHLYRTKPEDLHQEIPREQEVNCCQLLKYFDWVCLCLEGYSGYLRRGDIAVPPQQADHHDSWQSLQQPQTNFPLLWSELEIPMARCVSVYCLDLFDCVEIKYFESRHSLLSDYNILNIDWS